MSNSTDPAMPEPLFQGGLRGHGVVAAVRFRCGVCNELVVSEPGQACDACTAPVKTRPPARSRRPRGSTKATASEATGGGES
ncbi:hypothetical protein G1H11_11060 [Phytoactinopolyspora alkaliphila]|uniref:Uncharacterized protein n=1 Tax=Phytoactinopolyspora alkaliphila TaxID=1783498 RepID=A0A6N9YLQ2_9ACTN|nr:hypothetical protein [Phytoactinopolyspora alkaliphila]NED95850.1 hypothetical protein [Phytoactinopolyspora alkaliphila]